MSSVLELGFFASGELLSRGLEDEEDGEVRCDHYRIFWDQDNTICMQVWDSPTNTFFFMEFDPGNFMDNIGYTLNFVTKKRKETADNQIEAMCSYMLQVVLEPLHEPLDV